MRQLSSFFADQSEYGKKVAMNDNPGVKLSRMENAGVMTLGLF